MKTIHSLLASTAVVFFTFNAAATIRYVNASNPSPSAPYIGWSSAATNIQDAIDASGDGDQILVTNGVYRFGGKVMAGDLTNRVALDKAVAVQSVNGPFVTTIMGNGQFTGPGAVRCAWLTNDASLTGFTLAYGGTRSGGDLVTLQSGGGVWCASSNSSVVANCIIATNAAYYTGAGAFGGSINTSVIRDNQLSSSTPFGTAVFGARLYNCTITGNRGLSASAYAVYLSRLVNCIVYYNYGFNYYGGNCLFYYCCTAPAVADAGGFTTPPQLFADGIHLSTGSPCIGAGIAPPPTSTDIFGKPWANPPSVGCAEWLSDPLAGQPQINLTRDPIGFTATAAVSGQTPMNVRWLRNGAMIEDDGHFSGSHTTNLVATGVSCSDATTYQIVVSNAVGVVTGAVAQLVAHCVDAAGTSPIAPYSTWDTAATNIQDAVDAAYAGEIVFVTNGLYATGGKVMDHTITNRVALDKPILLQSMNGADSTIIQGAWDPVYTNNIRSVRCVWMTNNAVVNGFTLRGGSTQSGGWGGGVLGPPTNNFRSPNAFAINCIIVGNSAYSFGGGARYVTANNCTIASNSVPLGTGGGAHACALRNCLITRNMAAGVSGTGGGTESCYLANCAVIQNIAGSSGGGAHSSTLVNCTVSGNRSLSSSSGSAGVASSTLTNCIVWNNTAPPSVTTSNYDFASTFYFSCTAPTPSGMNNLTSDPLLLADGIHLSAASPCIGAGTPITVGTDIDGQTWNTPPSRGCDEWHPEPLVTLPPTYQIGIPVHGLTFAISPAGQAPFTCFWSKDGTLIQDDGHHSNSSTTDLVLNNLDPADTGAYQVIVSNAFGVVTSAVSQIVIHAVNAAGANPVPPYSTWATAATNIQDAIDVAAAGEIVLVTNGIYSSGGKAMAGGLTNRVALDKPLTVISANGPWETIIPGAWDPATTNGPLAIRCAWITNGAVLNGFTLRNGATRGYSGTLGAAAESGGGAWSSSTDGVVANCVLTNNRAIYGGAIAYGTLRNSLATFNMATLFGGCAYYANLNNCTVLYNYTTTSYANRGAGTYDGVIRNSIVLYNYDNYPIAITEDDYYTFNPPSPANYSYSCTRPNAQFFGPMPSGIGNINANTTNPQFLDLFHIAATSPLRGAASSAFVEGLDLDGEPFANPPSMGCDEVIEANLTGPLTIDLVGTFVTGSQTNLLVNRPAFFFGVINGRASRVEWSFGDGPVVTNLGASTSHQWINAGDYTVTFTAFNNDHPAGVSTNLVVTVVPLEMPQLSSVLMATNGFQFEFPGQPGATYTIQYATNLTPPIVWQTLQNIYFSNGGTHQITDSADAAGSRFYRVIAQ